MSRLLSERSQCFDVLCIDIANISIRIPENVMESACRQLDDAAASPNATNENVTNGQRSNPSKSQLMRVSLLSGVDGIGNTNLVTRTKADSEMKTRNAAWPERSRRLPVGDLSNEMVEYPMANMMIANANCIGGASQSWRCRADATRAEAKSKGADHSIRIGKCRGLSEVLVAKSITYGFFEI